MTDPIIVRYARAISETREPRPTHSLDGMLLDDGVPSEQDYREALELYRQVAKHDEEEAYFLRAFLRARVPFDYWTWKYTSTHFHFTGAEDV